MHDNCQSCNNCGCCPRVDYVVSGYSHLTHLPMKKIGSAEDRNAKAREIIDEAVKTAEDEETGSSAGSEGRVHSRRRMNLTKRSRERRSEITAVRTPCASKRKRAIDKRFEAIEQREASFAAKEEEIKTA